VGDSQPSVNEDVIAWFSSRSTPVKQAKEASEEENKVFSTEIRAALSDVHLRICRYPP
jgi:hypothetical protein